MFRLRPFIFILLILCVASAFGADVQCAATARADALTLEPRSSSAAALDASNPERSADVLPIHRDTARFKLAEKVGWYRFDDGSEQFMTWSSDGGLTLSDFRARRTLRLRPATEEVFTARDEGGEEYEVRFRKEGSGQVAGFSLLDSRGVERHAERLKTAPYHQQERTFSNGRIELAGLLVTPPSPGPHPAVIFVTGSDEGQRDKLWYLYQADYLARRGTAVFLPDRRGSGKSSGDWQSATFEDLAGDAIAAARHLKDHDRIDPARVGLLGFREGGWIAPLAAAKSTDIRFLVTVSGSAVTPREQMRHEISSDVRRYGTPDFLVPLIAYALEFRSTNKEENWWDRNGRFEPIPHWEKVSVPTLVIYGNERDNVPVRRSVELLEEARRKSGNANFTIRVLDDTGHMMEDPQTEWIKAEYLELLATWISTQAA